MEYFQFPVPFQLNENDPSVIRCKLIPGNESESEYPSFFEKKIDSPDKYFDCLLVHY